MAFRSFETERHRARTDLNEPERILMLPGAETSGSGNHEAGFSFRRITTNAPASKITWKSPTLGIVFQIAKRNRPFDQRQNSLSFPQTTLALAHNHQVGRCPTTCNRWSSHKPFRRPHEDAPRDQENPNTCPVRCVSMPAVRKPDDAVIVANVDHAKVNFNLALVRRNSKRGTLLAVKGDKLVEVEVGQDIAMHDKEGFVEILYERQRSGRTCWFLLIDITKSH